MSLSHVSRARLVPVVHEVDITIGGSGPAIQRMRLADEYDPYATGGSSATGAAGSNAVGTELEADVMQYYEFIADRGADVSALVCSAILSRSAFSATLLICVFASVARPRASLPLWRSRSSIGSQRSFTIILVSFSSDHFCQSLFLVWSYLIV